MSKYSDEFAEIEAMKIVAKAMKDLEHDAQRRVLAWDCGQIQHPVTRREPAPPSTHRIASKQEGRSRRGLTDNIRSGQPRKRH
jgi:hypothetical protein